MLNTNLKNEFDSLLPGAATEAGASRRTALKTALGVGYAATAMPIMAQTAINTSSDGLKTGETSYAVNGFKVPVFTRRLLAKPICRSSLSSRKSSAYTNTLPTPSAVLPKPATWRLRPSCSHARATRPNTPKLRS